MNKYFQESSILLFSVAKWVILASIVGIIVGFSTGLFLEGLQKAVDFTGHYADFYYLIPLGMAVSALLVKYLAPEAQAKGTEKVISAIHKQSGKIDLIVVPVKAIATIITIASGGSAGRKGPSALVGAGLASYLATLMGLDDDDRKKLVICGLSAAFSSVIGTPIAGAIFGVEVLYSGRLLYEILLPSMVAGMISFQVTSAMGVDYYYKPFHFVPEFSHWFFFKMIFFGIIMGVISLFFIEVIELG